MEYFLVQVQVGFQTKDGSKLKKEYIFITNEVNSDENTRLKVWDEIEKFESKREKNGGKYSKANGGWIDQEQAKYTQKLLEQKNIKYQAIFIDEVQDLTELQIAIMLNILEGKKKFEVAGDTSQSVYPSAFRWEDLRLQIYKTLGNKESHKHHRMDTNYRSTPYLVDAANLILDEHEHIMGETRTTIRQRTDRLEKGNHPSIIRLSEDELINHLRDLNLPNVFCPLLVRDNTIVNRLSIELATDEQRNENELNPNVMTIPGCKGLEYENVIMWDPCSGSNRLLDDYYHYKKGNSITDSDAISLELRHLFVGITRSRYRLSLIGPEDDINSTKILSGLAYFEGKKEFSVENRDILKGFTKDSASSDDFVEEARKFESRGHYNKAADAYRSAGLSYDRNRCRGEYYQGINDYRKASDFFELAANETNDSVQQKHFYSRANDCLDYILEQEKDVDILDKKARLCSYIGDILGAKQINAYRYELLGDNNSDDRSLYFKKAAKLFEEIGYLEDALRLYKQVDSYLDIAKISVQIGNENDFFNSIENYLKNDEKHFIILYSIFSGENAWKESISKLLKVDIYELPNSNIVLKKQLLYADDAQKSVLKLQGAKNWSDTVQAYKEMGDYRKASEILIENQYFELALELLKKNKKLQLLNGPINKKRFFKGKYPGVTEYLGSKTKRIKDVVMLIFNRKLSVSPITTHVPLKEVHLFISKKKIINHVKLINEFYKKRFKIKPKIALTGLNPHCESNFKSSEEKKVIIPAMKYLIKQKYNVFGPFPADTIFLKNNLIKFDVIIGMYHDQVLGPMKSIFEFNAINITLGLPFNRVSPDHGPNEKMFGKNKSNPSSLLKALKFLDN